MKLYFKTILVVAALATAVFVSCNKNNDPYGDDDNYVAQPVVTPTYADHAVVVDLSATPVTTKNGDKIKSIEFTESGYAIITKGSVAHAAPSAMTKASDSEETTTVTTYTFSNGVYDVLGFGKVEIKGATVTITATGSGEAAPSEDYSGAAEVTSGNGNNDLYSSWKIYSTNVTVKGSGISVDHIFEGTKAASLYEMANYINEKKHGIEADDFKDYDIESVTLTKNGTFMVKFKKAKPYVGEFKLTGKTFSYKLNVEGNFALNAEADGSVEIDTETNLCVLDINGKFNYNNDTYTTKLTLKLEQLQKVN